ncbi:MAG: DUF2059 domain-containing protein [Burkholderiaceae bacterium]|jgi:hypothetical protein|nr:DUF2059 domain-containing protein [Burkholderiaceae bacterium]MCZ8175763.1 DUF2059 domain-containing protein [Burkholderiaceae bacterium]
MKPKLPCWAWAVSLLAMLLLAPGPALAQVDPGTAERLLRKSGLWAQLDGVAAQVRQGLVEAVAQGGRAPEPADAERLAAAASAAYAADRLRGVALRGVAQSLDPRQLKALLEWYDAPTGVRMTRLEEAAAADPRDSDAVIADGQARLQAMSAERQARLEALLQASGAIDATVSMTLNTVAGVRQGLASMLPPGEGPSPEATRALLAQQLPQLRPAFEQMLRPVMAAIYAEASDAQLADYAAFLRSPAGQHLNDLLLRVMDEAFLDAATELGRRLAPAAGKPA